MISLIYLVLLSIYAVVGLVVAVVVFRRSKKKRRWLVFPVFLFIYLPLPWADMVFKCVIIFSRTFGTSLQEIHQTIGSPQSVFWLDNVWPGFDEYGRHWMVANYLDGKHLKVLAMNGDDGKIYLYRATETDFIGSEKLRMQHERLIEKKKELEARAKQAGRAGRTEEKDKLWQAIQDEHHPEIRALGYGEKRKQEVNTIFSRPEIYQKVEELPLINYLVEFNPISLTSIEKKFLWADEIRITSTQSGETIAYSKRYMSYGWWLGFTPQKSFHGGVRRGDERVYEFDDKVLFEYAGVMDTLEVTKDNLDRSFYRLIQ